MSDAILPAYQYEDGDANPNRLNPRMASAAKGEAGPGLESSYAEFFDENQGGEANKASLLSLINDTINRTPMDLIQVRVVSSCVPGTSRLCRYTHRQRKPLT